MKFAFYEKSETAAEGDLVCGREITHEGQVA